MSGSGLASNLELLVFGGFLLVLVLAVSVSIAWRSRPVARIILLGSALVISAALFLPSSTLRELVGPEALSWLQSVSGTHSLTVEGMGHFIAYLWLALVLWTFRPDLRGWRVVVGLLVLAIAQELVQGVTVERSPRLDDVGVNLLGAGVGLVLATIGSGLWKIARPREIRP